MKQKWQELINTEISYPRQEATCYKIIIFSLEYTLRIRSCSLVTLKNPNKDSLEANFIQAKFLLINFMINDRGNWSTVRLS